MSKLTKAAQGKSCTIRIPGYCNGNSETTVPAHFSSIRLGHGVGEKVHDLLTADACSCCHDVVDNRVRCESFTRIEVRLMHAEGVMETQLRRIKEGLITI